MTLWIDESVLSQGHVVNERKRKRGAPTHYSAWVIREVYHLTLRALEGFLRSIVQWMGLKGVCVPDYTTISIKEKDYHILFF